MLSQIGIWVTLSLATGLWTNSSPFTDTSVFPFLKLQMYKFLGIRQRAPMFLMVQIMHITKEVPDMSVTPFKTSQQK